MLTVLVLGGYGFFGARIAKALAEDARIRVLIGGRDLKKAAGAARALGLPEQQSVAIDAHGGDLAARLRELGVGVVVHTAGPFQTQGYGVAQAAIDAGCHYIDLADGRAFVAGITGLDAQARQKRVSVISGASSLPALSSAVVDRYTPRFAELTAIHIGIATGARAPGLATVRAVFGYLGKPFTRLEDGAWVTTHGWFDLHRHRFPEPVGARWLASCDVPDLGVLPARYATVRTVTFHAGFASGIGHLALCALAGLVRAGLLNSAVPLAGSLNRLARIVEPALSDRGGMFVTLEGIDDQGEALSLTWNLLAAQNHGPQIPCGAAIALVRKLANGDALPVGAMACVGLLSVEEFLAPLRELDVVEVPP
ncbi:MAG TPA: saccharopine dehydrogenase NADP-binding domain-containing protein [Gammaproteobacteria bacterium]|nr:saccharopine dehydrogenase NADP-binding domain-containing protein [Gammaproteobacteria bacterium]